MPKIVDADQRREHIADAVLRLVARQGVAAASLRNVAEEADLNVGSVRHYFTNHTELLQVAVTVMAERVETRIARRAATHDGSSGERALELLLDLVCELLPLDEERRAEAIIFLAFAEHARTNPELGDVTGSLFRGPRALAELAYEHFDLDPTQRELAVAALAATIDGLTLLGVHRPEELPPDRARDVIRWQFLSVIRTSGAGSTPG
ncbi:TetR/AcrR family transcriptional regulator [Propionibacteriaceae bacterium Y2011]